MVFMAFFLVNSKFLNGVANIYGQFNSLFVVLQDTAQHLLITMLSLEPMLELVTPQVL